MMNLAEVWGMRDKRTNPCDDVKGFLNGSASESGAVPDVLLTDIATLCAYRRDAVLNQALWCARLILVAGLFNPEDRRQLLEALGFLLTELRYEDWDETDPRTKSLSLPRAQCVLLAEAFRDATVEDPTVHGWIAERSSDPFPEVRFAAPKPLQ